MLQFGVSFGSACWRCAEMSPSCTARISLLVVLSLISSPVVLLSAEDNTTDLTIPTAPCVECITISTTESATNSSTTIVIPTVPCDGICETTTSATIIVPTVPCEGACNTTESTMTTDSSSSASTTTATTEDITTTLTSSTPEISTESSSATDTKTTSDISTSPTEKPPPDNNDEKLQKDLYIVAGTLGGLLLILLILLAYVLTRFLRMRKLLATEMVQRSTDAGSVSGRSTETSSTTIPRVNMPSSFQPKN